MKKFIEWLQNAEEGEQERSNMRSTYSVQWMFAVFHATYIIF
jgi:hypothetical protein